MSEQAPMPESSPEAASSKEHAPRTAKRPRRTARWMIVLLLLIVIGIGVQQLAAVRFWESLDNEAGQIATVDSRLAALEASIADQNRLRDDIAQMQQSLKQERALLVLDRIEQQLDAGWQTWVGTGDPKVLVGALQTAQRTLAHEPGAAEQALRLAVNHDLLAIKAQPVVDLRAAVESLDGVIASIDQLPLIQDRRIPEGVASEAQAAADETPAATLLERARQIAGSLARDLWQTVRGMVRVQRLDHAEAGLIAPEQKVFLQQGLRLLLLDARHALIMRNTVVYQQTLNQARAWIQKYADSADARVKEDLATLQRLAALNVDQAVMSLEDTRQALAAARAALTGEPLPGPETEAADPVAPVAATPPQEAPKADAPEKSAQGAAQ